MLAHTRDAALSNEGKDMDGKEFNQCDRRRARTQGTEGRNGECLCDRPHDGTVNMYAVKLYITFAVLRLVDGLAHVKVVSFLDEVVEELFA